MWSRILGCNLFWPRDQRVFLRYWARLTSCSCLKPERDHPFLTYKSYTNFDTWKLYSSLCLWCVAFASNLIHGCLQRIFLRYCRGFVVSSSYTSSWLMKCHRNWDTKTIEIETQQAYRYLFMSVVRFAVPFCGRASKGLPCGTALDSHLVLAWV